ncbi:MAG: hypothetical protein ACTHU0_30570, partial [Kofleriaceae bacterium]
MGRPTDGATLPDETDAGDAFALFAEDLWHSLRRFDGRCTTRTGWYMLARPHAHPNPEARAPRREVAQYEGPPDPQVAQV